MAVKVPQIHIDAWVREQLPHDVVMPEVRCNVKWRGLCRPSDLVYDNGLGLDDGMGVGERNP